MKKEYEFVVDAEFIKERDKVLDKQVKFLKSKGYEMGNSYYYYEWFKDVSERGWFLEQRIDLSKEIDVRKYYVYLSDVVLETNKDLEIVQKAFRRVRQDYLEVIKIGENKNE